MMKYEEFESKFIKENRFLKLSLGVSLVLLLCLVLLTKFQRSYFIYQGGEIFKARLLLVDICKEGFVSISKKAPHPFFVTDGIIESLKKTPFEISYSEISYLQEISEKSCRLIVKTASGPRSFWLGLKEDKDFPFAFKVSEIKESEFKAEKLGDEE